MIYLDVSTPEENELNWRVGENVEAELTNNRFVHASHVSRVAVVISSGELAFPTLGKALSASMHSHCTAPTCVRTYVNNHVGTPRSFRKQDVQFKVETFYFHAQYLCVRT